MPRKSGVFYVVLSLVFILVIGIVTAATDSDDSYQLTPVNVSEIEKVDVTVASMPHAPIVIDGDANFTAIASAEGWDGIGSPSDPFIIENLDIDLGGSEGTCILINNTRSHFVIRNCEVQAADIYLTVGIQLENVTDGIIINNHIHDNTHGIFVHSGSTRVTISSNNISDNVYQGIRIDVSSTYVTVVNNNCLNNQLGVYVSYSNYVIIVNNTFNRNKDHGIVVAWSHNNTIKNNTCDENLDEGIYLHESSSNTLTNNICTNNRYGIYIYLSNSNKISENICTSNSIGIYLTQSDSNTLEDNICASNSSDGIFLYVSSSNMIANNTCTSNRYGIWIRYHSNFNTFVNNICNNNDVGIYIHTNSDSHELHWNVLADNNLDGRDDTGTSDFSYNYWSDYSGTDTNGDGIGDTPYAFTGNSDFYPLMYQSNLRWIKPPMDQSIEFEYLFQYDMVLVQHGPLGPLTWSISDSIHFSCNQGVVESNTILPKGDYALEVDVTNFYGCSLRAAFTVRVTVDASNPPGWLTIPIDQVIVYGEMFDYQVMVVDPSGIDHWELNDTAHFAITESYYVEGSTARITSSSDLAIGQYVLIIDVFDTYGNMLSTIITITVEPSELDTIPPEWVTLRIYQTIEVGEPLQMQLEAWDYEGIDHWWLNDTTHFMLDGQGVIRNATVLNPGIYRLEVRAYDPYDNYCSAGLVVTVLEAPMTKSTTSTTTPPTISAILEEVDSVMMLVLGAGIGGVSVVVVVLVILRKK
ncbi:MAG: right-handed parallel beta-helix repeat-containing protein [Candidatus Thorarchaeota archaeon SMTZ1-45]|nr:MAG: hypothetical protein AM325_14755 [Candidatus Thorarchaeota archaeon SMTZ1-45]